MHTLADKAITSATNYVEFAVFAIEYNLRLAGRETRDERGAVTTETAVIIAILVAVAAAAGITFMARAMSNARAVPSTPPVPDRP